MSTERAQFLDLAYQWGGARPLAPLSVTPLCVRLMQNRIKMSGLCRVAQSVKSINQYKYLGIALDTELSEDKDIQRQLLHQYCAANKLRASFSRCSNAVKNVLCSFCTSMRASPLWCNFRKPCMQRLRVSYVISGKHTSADCVWPITLVAGLCTTCRSEQVL